MEQGEQSAGWLFSSVIGQKLKGGGRNARALEAGRDSGESVSVREEQQKEMFHRYCELPDLVQSQVLSNLDLRQRIKAESVCKDFQMRLRRPGLWKGVNTIRLCDSQICTNRPDLGCVLELPGKKERPPWSYDSKFLMNRWRTDLVVIGLTRYLAGLGVKLESLELERLRCMTCRGIHELMETLTETGTKLRLTGAHQYDGLVPGQRRRGHRTRDCDAAAEPDERGSAGAAGGGESAVLSMAPAPALAAQDEVQLPRHPLPLHRVWRQGN